MSLIQSQASVIQRNLTPIDTRLLGGRVIVEGREYLDFSANDYLGFSMDQDLIPKRYETGHGSTGSRLLSGDHYATHALEDAIAVWKDTEAALVFNTGYQMNVGLLDTILSKDDVVFADKAIHASLIDGIRLSGASCYRYRHNDPEHLRTLLQKNRGQAKKAWIITESVFSMDGTIPKLSELIQLKQEFETQLFVDEAHANGVYGITGAGQVEAQGVTKDVDICVGTFGKALGSMGAYCACSIELKDQLINQCRSFIYSTALPHPVIAFNHYALEKMQAKPDRRERLLDHVYWVRSALKKAEIPILGDSHIIPVLVGDTKATEELASSLKDQGFWVLPIRPPTVPKGGSRVRLTLSASHKRIDLEHLVNAIKTYWTA
ncbi:8-amino-7-oxononanoate synthase [bacterium]|jgi:8-amino-7-oxononanoate synthase|nr:8-amino-7-oxononanoate synthase [bacterium]